ncbi:nitroreductase family protein [Lactiplantibacillus plantarum]|uniref:nitroreductase family protein n=1 Tax=Lactiplantibacillus TaxID=2767842 RepID=UPI0021A38C38|nr:nitroreductase family protein [Lactiplantibacillus pentosus]MCT3306878.1 hypothetical protein [Lactiplantibacillus pentosus]
MSIGFVMNKNLKAFLKQRLVLPARLRKQYTSDYRKFVSSSFLIRRDLTFDNLKGALTFQAHALEKGFIHEKFRPGFGNKAISALLNDLDLYISKQYPKDELRYKIAIDTLKEYLAIHQKLQFENSNTTRIKTWLVAHDEFDNAPVQDGGYFVQRKEQLEHIQSENFETFSNSRHSVRNFGGEKIPQSKIIDAIKLASNAPSVCNRQSYHVYQVHDIEKIKKILKVQAGINGLAGGISDLLVITTNAEYFRSVNERNQPYIDGGIFAMNLLYALHFEEIAACPLNADLDLNGEKFVKHETGMPSSDCIIMFVAIGEFQETNKIPLSRREGYEDILVQVR